MPKALRDPAYAKEREAIAVAVERTRIEADEDGRVSVETLRELRDAIRVLRTRIMAELPSNARRTEALNFLKANYGLARMLETPDLSNFLSSLNNVQTVSVGELLAFMTSFNLRFGVAPSPVNAPCTRTSSSSSAPWPRRSIPLPTSPRSSRHPGSCTPNRRPRSSPA